MTTNSGLCRAAMPSDLELCRTTIAQRACSAGSTIPISLIDVAESGIEAELKEKFARQRIWMVSARVVAQHLEATSVVGDIDRIVDRLVHYQDEITAAARPVVAEAFSEQPARRRTFQQRIVRSIGAQLLANICNADVAPGAPSLIEMAKAEIKATGMDLREAARALLIEDADRWAEVARTATEACSAGIGLPLTVPDPGRLYRPEGRSPYFLPDDSILADVYRRLDKTYADVGFNSSDPATVVTNFISLEAQARCAPSGSPLGAFIAVIEAQFAVDLPKGERKRDRRQFRDDLLREWGYAALGVEVPLAAEIIGLTRRSSRNRKIDGEIGVVHDRVPELFQIVHEKLLRAYRGAAPRPEDESPGYVGTISSTTKRATSDVLKALERLASSSEPLGEDNPVAWITARLRKPDVREVLRRTWPNAHRCGQGFVFGLTIVSDVIDAPIAHFDPTEGTDDDSSSGRRRIAQRYRWALNEFVDRRVSESANAETRRGEVARKVAIARGAAIVINALTIEHDPVEMTRLARTLSTDVFGTDTETSRRRVEMVVGWAESLVRQERPR